MNDYATRQRDNERSNFETLCQKLGTIAIIINMGLALGVLVTVGLMG